MSIFRRPLPIIVLADTSGSMNENGKIQSLNESLREMIKSLCDMQKEAEAEIKLTVITFGKEGVVTRFKGDSIKTMEWMDMEAEGCTPMAEAFIKAAELVSDPKVVAKNSYAPMLILVSDGQPTDNLGRLSNKWKDELKTLKDAPRVERGMSFSMGIGPDADEKVLRAFSSNDRVFKAAEGDEIRFFFRLVTTVTSITMGVVSQESAEVIQAAENFSKPEKEKNKKDNETLIAHEQLPAPREQPPEEVNTLSELLGDEPNAEF